MNNAKKIAELKAQIKALEGAGKKTDNVARAKAWAKDTWGQNVKKISQKQTKYTTKAGVTRKGTLIRFNNGKNLMVGTHKFWGVRV